MKLFYHYLMNILLLFNEHFIIISWTFYHYFMNILSLFHEHFIIIEG